MERSCTYGSECSDWHYFVCWNLEVFSVMTEEFIEIWAAEAWRVQESEPMLSWEACEMIAYANLRKKGDHESFNRQMQ